MVNRDYEIGMNIKEEIYVKIMTKFDRREDETYTKKENHKEKERMQE